MGSRPILLGNPTFCNFSGGPDPLPSGLIHNEKLYRVNLTYSNDDVLKFRTLLFHLKQNAGFPQGWKSQNDLQAHGPDHTSSSEKVGSGFALIANAFSAAGN